MACSAAARGRIRLAASAGRPIPRGWALDVDGNATEDAAAAMQGLVLPMAEHKGSGLALAYELFSAVLPGATLSKDVPRDFLRDGADTLDSWGVGHFALAIDIEATRAPAAFAAQADELVDAVHAVPPRRGFEGVQMPGERELHSAARYADAGIPLAAATFAGLEELAAELELDHPLAPVQEGIPP